MQLETRYEQSGDMVWRQVGDETILVPVHKEMGQLNNVYTLNRTAAFIWSRLDGSKTLAEIRDELVSEFEVEPGHAERDLMKCIGQFEEIDGIRQVS